MKKILHLLPNAHLDPVWFWDRFEGANEGIRTCRTMVKLLKEFPEMRFNRGEAFIYDHLKKWDPDTLEEIRELIQAGRWEIVGGNWVQTDDNMPLTETMNQQFAIGQAYFQQNFGQKAVTAWTPDSFGHSAGLPELLHFHGFKYVSFKRPSWSSAKEDVFIWRGQGGARVLACHLLHYTSDHDPSNRLDDLMQREAKRSRRNIAIGFGCGDHGGGTSRWQIENALKWAEQHPEIELRFSTFSEFFAALEKEIADGYPIEERSGELNFCLRGCYASLPGLKTAFRHAEKSMLRAERTRLTISTLLKQPAPSVEEDWRNLLFNSFHDILPGSLVRHAADQQKAQLAGVSDRALERENNALNQLIAHINMPSSPALDSYHPAPVPMLLFNPLPYPWKGVVEIEENLDYRPFYKEELPYPAHIDVRDATGKRLPLQEMKAEHNSMINRIWRIRGAMPVTLPPCGWKTITYGLASDGQPALPQFDTPATGKKNRICNQFWQITATPKRQHIRLKRADGQSFPLSLQLVQDHYGSWGGMSEEPDSFHLHTILEKWQISQVKLLDAGPVRSRLFIQMAGKNSHAEFTLSLDAESPVITGKIRTYLRDRGTRLMLALPQMKECLCDVPGGTALRKHEGEFPAVRYLKLHDDKKGTLGFAANGAYSFDNEKGTFRYGLAKNTIFSANQFDGTLLRPEETMEAESPEITFLISADDEHIAQAVDQMMNLPAVAAAWPHPGSLPGEGSILSIEPTSIRLLDIQTVNGKMSFTLQNCSDTTVQGKITLLGQPLTVELPPWKITTVR